MMPGERAIGSHSKDVKNARAVVGVCLVVLGASAWTGHGSRPAAARPQTPRPPDVNFVPTSFGIAEAMLDLAAVTRDDLVYDLGSGDGRIVILAAQKYGATGVGVEIEPALVERSREVARDGDVMDRSTFVEADLFSADFSRATVVTLSLSAEVNARLASKLKRELRPGTRIVSYQFGIGGWTPDETVRAADGSPLYLWIVR